MMRVSQEQAFVLHHYSYGETSLLLEMFTRQNGRLGMVAKGARRARSPLRATLIPFQLLAINFSGRGELPTLASAEPLTAFPVFTGEGLYCGLYLNELLLRLLHRHDPHENLFQSYSEALVRLATDSGREAVLRIFEKRLLEDIGYGLVLDHEVQEGGAVQPEREYRYLPEQGPVPADQMQAGEPGILVSGKSLLALAREDLDDVNVLRETKRLLRGLLVRQLGSKPLASRRLFQTGQVGTALE